MPCTVVGLFRGVEDSAAGIVLNSECQGVKEGATLTIQIKHSFACVKETQEKGT